MLITCVMRIRAKTLTPSPWTTAMDYAKGLPRSALKNPLSNQSTIESNAMSILISCKCLLYFFQSMR